MITFIKASEYKKNLKATIQASGRLGFTSDTATVMHLTDTTVIKFASDNENKKELYLVIVENEDEDSFKCMKATEYFYLTTSKFFTALEYDFRRSSIVFDLVRKPELDGLLNGIVYKMNERPKKNKRERIEKGKVIENVME